MRSSFDTLISAEASEIKIVDPTCNNGWDPLVSSYAESTFFHGSVWLRVLSKTYNHKPLALCCSRDGEARALVPLLEVVSRFSGRRGISLPFTDFCQPLILNECDAPVIFRAVRALARERNWKHFEFRGAVPSNLSARPSLVFYRHVLDLRGNMGFRFAKLESSVRRAIRRARKGGLAIELSGSRDAMRDFYRLHVQTRHRHGLPPQPFSFFRNIHEEIVKPGFGFVCIAKHGSQPVASAIFFSHGKARRL